MFTDACYERDARDLICGFGGVFIDESSVRKSFFSCSLKCKQREFLGELSKKQIIFEAETLCALLAYLVWMKQFEVRNSVLYVDNEGTKFCMMKGTSDNSTVDVLCGVFAELEVLVETKCWLARVLFFSNIADKPSRGISHEFLAASYVDE